MKIPKHLLYPGISKDKTKRLEAFVESSRKKMKDAPTFNTTEEAVQEAVKQAKEDEYSFPSVWKEPQDVGKKHAVVHMDLREDAQNAGYSEEIGEQKIFDLANGRDVDEIEEV